MMWNLWALLVNLLKLRFMDNLKPIWFTSANLKYLDRAAILAESMKEIHNDWESVLVLVDEKPANDELFGEFTKDFDVIITPEELGVSSPRSWFKPTKNYGDFNTIRDWLCSLSVVEACTAIKPFAFAHLAKTNRPIFYLDPDTVAFSSLDVIWESLKSGVSIVVTPHILAPSNDYQAIIDNEIGALQYGIFNFGFLALNPRSENAIKFIEYWQERLKYFCTENTKNGLFTDQKWGNLLPTFYDDLLISRHPGMNVANWNLENRHLSFNPEGDCLVNGEPLIFYHFSKAGDAGKHMTARYAKDNTTVAELWRWYLSKLAQNSERLSKQNWKHLH